ncbi:hypothetical protein K3F51_06720 [Limosilactobacillus reuteri]|uniref:glycoside hydrolase family 66 protein n=1 Tax=Limosilactobacillus reuteri TaxID=1598 RepID=UPI0021D86776|nr:glycoside hydrolase family 66 protein [Limosilactobacillus reuteri]UAW59505.1 hypothetical protein K3F51_06720 [Limosilactobacillus reuteri]
MKYYIYQGVGSDGELTKIAEVTDKKEYTATGLTANSTYRFAVSAYNGRHESAKSNIVTVKTIQDYSSIDTLYTDKAIYKPGEQLELTFNADSPATVTIQIYNFGELIVDKKTICQSGTNHWTWTIPNEDYEGYIIKASAGANAQYIGVNVNGNVANVPIEGFLGDFGPNLSESNMQKVVKQMNRMHVNYVQFYDWYDRDDMPLRIVNGQPEQNWLDFMKRPISFNTVKSYIDAVHQYGMQAMLYNLIYGSQLGITTSDDSNLNWVNPNLTKEMFLYKDTKAIQTAGENDQSFGGKLNITYMNVLNGAWKNYLCGQINNVYKYLPFDGWHVDQLGSLPDDTYSFDGYHLKWWDYGDGYGGMLKTAKQVSPNKRLTINATDGLGIEKIMASNTVDFVYVEPWTSIGYSFEQLANFIRKTNQQYKKPVVLASYVNKEKADGKNNNDGMVNDAAALLCDAMEMANGASHLEFGEHYLANEYFPNHTLKLSDETQRKLMSYMDNFVAYLMILNGKWVDDEITSSTHSLSTTFEKDKITTVYKRSSRGGNCIAD